MTIYAIGSNGSGQLGIGHKEDVSVPKEVLFQNEPPKDVISVKAGGNHTLLLSSTGTLYCSGDATTGACGLTSSHGSQPSHIFHKVELPEEMASSPIRFCAATWEASIIVQQDENGKATKLYSFGTGNKGELGLGEFLFRSAKPQLIKDFPPGGSEIVDLAASVSHVVVVLSNGDVYGWGSGRKGQLGETTGVFSSPQKVAGPDFKVARAACGREFTYLLSGPEDGQHAILGSEKWNVKSAPLSIAGWKDLGASWGSIYVLREGGDLISWGRDDHGQLTPPKLPSVLQIAIGSEHALVLTENGEVCAWGWGEHGNCGPKTTNGDVKGRWNVVASSNYLPVGSKISYIGAGCATSWIYLSG